MESEFQCYYPTCRKYFQTKAYLVTHINTCHNECKIYKCCLCDTYSVSIDNLSIHQAQHRNFAVKQTINNSFLSNLPNNLTVEFSPPNILQLPVLPPIDNERTRLAFSYKLPLSIMLYEEMIKNR